MKIIQYNLNGFVKSNKLILLVSLFVLLQTSCKQEKEYISTTNHKAKISQIYAKYLDSCSISLNAVLNASERKEKKTAFLQSRRYFKKVEPFLLRFEKNNYNVLNGPNLDKISEEDITDIRIAKPQGYQVLEEVLFNDEKIDSVFLKAKVMYIKSKLDFMKQNNFIEKRSLANFLESIKLSIINIALKGITGFDSPVTNNSLIDAKWNYEALITYFEILETNFKNKNLYNAFLKELNNSIKILESSDFNSFDRYSFIKDQTQKQLSLIDKIAVDWNIKMTKNLAINFDSSKIFSKSFFNDKSFSVAHLPNENDSITKLGKALFYDKNLSKSKNMSCATCHAPKKAFTDGLPKAIGANGKKLLRNSPTLIYSQYQSGLFYDMRVSSLESQISDVINNEDEFHQNIDHIVEYISKNEYYNKEFKKYYKNGITSLNVRHAISNYTRSLASFSSKFDKNMNDKENNLTDLEKKGFNIFMGKGLCATCHFPPLFNGTVPPYFKETELEVIGVPKTAKNKSLDDDLGRYNFYKTEERKFAFKTPTIRNIAKTDPYMHNGVYKTLEEVMNFYNKGGGEGLGYEVPNQTLPFDNLNLSENEIKAVIAFMKTLTDKEYSENY